MKSYKPPNNRLEVLIGATNTMSIIDGKGRYSIARLRDQQTGIAYRVSGIESQTGEKWSILLDESLKVARASIGISKATQEKVRDILAMIGAPERCIQKERSLEEEEDFAGWVVDMN